MPGLDLSAGNLALALLLGSQTRLAAYLFCFAIVVSTLCFGQGTNLSHLQRFTISLLPAGTSRALALLGPGSYSMDARHFGRNEIVIESIDRNR